jgi:hypothetical protein
VGGTAIAALVMALLEPAPEPIELAWSAPPECPSQDQLRASVSGMLGGASAREQVHADVSVVRESEGYAADVALVIDGRRSTRRLVATSCSALAEATALVIAVSVDPVRALEESPGEPAAAQIPEPRVVEPPTLPVVEDPVDRSVAIVPDASTAPPPRRPGAYVRILGGADYGTTPAITGMLGGAVGLRGRDWRAELDGSWAFARSTSLTIAPEARAALGRWSIGARGCGVPTRGRIEVPLCAAIEAGAIEGDGTGGTIGARHARRPWIAAVLGPAIAITVVPRLALLLGVDLVAPLWRARFVIGSEEIHRPRPIGVRALLGAELRLGRRP